MRWLISKEIDCDVVEFQERMRFYSKIRKRELHQEIEMESALKNFCYVFNDGHIDNRYMLVGHTDFATSLMLCLKANAKRNFRFYKFYVCACIISFEYFCIMSGIESGDDVYVSKQVLEEVERKECYTCEFLRKEETRLGFKATKSELGLLKTNIKSFYGRLNQCFTPLEVYRNVGVAE